MSLATALREIAAILVREAAALEGITEPKPEPAGDFGPRPAPPAPAPSFIPFGYPTYPVASLDSNTPGKGVNHYCVVDSTPIVVPVTLPGLTRIDTVATADTPARGGAFYTLVLTDAHGTTVRQQTVANGATIMFDGLEGSFALAFSTDAPSTAWVVFR